MNGKSVNNARGGRQTTLTRYATGKLNQAPTGTTNGATEALKRRRADTVIHKQGNPHPSLRGTNVNNAQLKKKTSAPAKNVNNLDDVVVDNNRKLDSNGMKLDEVLRGIATFNNRFEEIESRVNVNSDNISDAGLRLNYLEQKTLNCQMEISGIDATNVPSHALKNEVTKFIIDMGITVNSEHIVDAYKINRTIRGNQQTIIIVTFIHEAIKRSVIRNKIRIDKQNGNCHVYFSDVLTRTNRQILMEARQLKKRCQIFGAWTFSGEIFIKAHEQSKRIKISTLEQLYDYSGIAEQANNDSDESEYESVVQTRKPTPLQAQISNHVVPPALFHGQAKPNSLAPKMTQDPKNNSMQGTYAQSLNYPANTPLLNDLTANNSSKNNTANNLLNVLTANNSLSTKNTANNSSSIINTANNLSSVNNTGKNSITQTPTGPPGQRAHSSNTYQPANSSLMLYDTPTVIAPVDDPMTDQMLVDLVGDNGAQDLDI